MWATGLGVPQAKSSVLLFSLRDSFLVVTHFVPVGFGSGGINMLAAVMGFTDVDPFHFGFEPFGVARHFHWHMPAS